MTPGQQHNGFAMTSIDIQERPRPRQDGLGLGLFLFHLGVGGVVLAGWLVHSDAFLVAYMVLLPAIATQWYVNRGCCVLNNIESWIRTGRWRDPDNFEEGRFLLMICYWLLAIRPDPVLLDRLSYSSVLALWLLAFGHFLSMPN